MLSELAKRKAPIWISNGLHFGYPDCCIINFCERDFTMTKEQHEVHCNTGFIPCPSCSQKILNGEETLSSLIKNRQHVHPFPLDFD